MFICSLITTSLTCWMSLLWLRRLSSQWIPDLEENSYWSVGNCLILTCPNEPHLALDFSQLQGWVQFLRRSSLPWGICGIGNKTLVIFFTEISYEVITSHNMQRSFGKQKGLWRVNPCCRTLWSCRLWYR